MAGVAYPGLLDLPVIEVSFVYYTDPGTGALLWQMLSAGAIGLLFYVNKAARLLRTIKKRVFKG